MFATPSFTTGFEDELDQWDRSLRSTVSDKLWAEMTAQQRLSFAHARAVYLFCRDHRDRLPELKLCTRRPKAVTHQSMFDEVAERRRRAATVDYQSGIPKRDMSVDGTFFLASKMNMSDGMELSYEFDGDALTNHNKQFATYTSEQGRILALRFTNSGSAAESAAGLEQIAKRPGCPTSGLVINIDNVPPTSIGTSTMEQVLMAASGAEWVGQDNFHVTQKFSGAGNNHHPDFRRLVILGFRDATRKRVAAIEREVDLKVLHGLVKLKRTVPTGPKGAKATYTIRPWKLEQDAIKEAWKQASDPTERSARMADTNALG